MKYIVPAFFLMIMMTVIMIGSYGVAWSDYIPKGEFPPDEEDLELIERTDRAKHLVGWMSTEAAEYAVLLQGVHEENDYDEWIED